MTDLKNLLELALTDGHGPDRDQSVDPAADLARGQRLRRRRQLAGVGGGTAVAAGIAAVAVVVSSAGPSAARPHQAPVAGPASHHVTATLPSAPARAASDRPRPSRSIALVSYHGQQIPGYQVARVPRGWVIQGGNSFSLVIAPRGDKDTNIDSFVGKIVVMLKSADEQVPVHDQRQPVAGRPGYIHDQGPTHTMTYQDAAGSWVDIQVPSSLGWNGARFARFASGVQVLGNAQPGRG